MRVILNPVGSGGDVLPFVGIGRELRRRGHDVVLVTAEPFRAVTEAHAIPFVSQGSVEEFESAVRNPDVWHPRRGPGLIMRMVAEHGERAYRLLDGLVPSRDTIIVSHVLAFAARTLQEVRGIPNLTVHLAPGSIRSAITLPSPAPGVSTARWPATVKRLLWWFADRRLIDPHVLPALNPWRASLGLPPVDRVFGQWANSPDGVLGLFPEWFGPDPGDWPRPIHLTGFPLFDHDGTQPSSALERFLGDGDPPVAFTPGTANALARPFFLAALDASRRLGARALLLTRYRELLPDPLPPHAHHEPYAPLSRTLPRCSALVHHGGVGTIAQALATGTPQCIMPMGFDQPDNVTRVSGLGVGTWLSPRRFTGPRLAKRLGDLLGDPGIRVRCQHWQGRTDPSGIGRACDVIEQQTASPSS